MGTVVISYMDEATRERLRRERDDNRSKYPWRYNKEEARKINQYFCGKAAGLKAKGARANSKKQCGGW